MFFLRRWFFRVQQSSRTSSATMQRSVPVRSLANGNTPCGRSQLWALQRSGQGPGSRYQVAASKSMAGDQKLDQKRSRNRWKMGIQVTIMPPKKWMFHPENDTIWSFTRCVKYSPNPTPQGKQNIKTWMSKDLNMGGHMENSWKFHEKICGKFSFYCFSGCFFKPWIRRRSPAGWPRFGHL